MANKKMTPNWVVENYLYNFKQRWCDYMNLTHKSVIVSKFTPDDYDGNIYDEFIQKVFPEALESLLKDQHKRSCRAQRVECTKTMAEYDLSLKVYACDNADYETTKNE